MALGLLLSPLSPVQTPVVELDLELEATPVELELDAMPVELELDATPVELELDATPVELELVLKRSLKDNHRKKSPGHTRGREHPSAIILAIGSSFHFGCLQIAVETKLETCFCGSAMLKNISICFFLATHLRIVSSSCLAWVCPAEEHCLVFGQQRAQSSAHSGQNPFLKDNTVLGLFICTPLFRPL